MNDKEVWDSHWTFLPETPPVLEAFKDYPDWAYSSGQLVDFGLAAARKALQNKWLPIHTAPKSGTLILATDHGPALGWWSVADDGWTGGFLSVLYPTHWLPIPEMPPPNEYD